MFKFKAPATKSRPILNRKRELNWATPKDKIRVKSKQNSGITKRAQQQLQDALKDKEIYLDVPDDSCIEMKKQLQRLQCKVRTSMQGPTPNTAFFVSTKTIAHYSAKRLASQPKRVGTARSRRMLAQAERRGTVQTMSSVWQQARSHNPRVEWVSYSVFKPQIDRLSQPYDAHDVRFKLPISSNAGKEVVQLFITDSLGTCKIKAHELKTYPQMVPHTCTHVGDLFRPSCVHWLTVKKKKSKSKYRKKVCDGCRAFYVDLQEHRKSAVHRDWFKRCDWSELDALASFVNKKDIERRKIDKKVEPDGAFMSRDWRLWCRMGSFDKKEPTEMSLLNPSPKSSPLVSSPLLSNQPAPMNLDEDIHISGAASDIDVSISAASIPDPEEMQPILKEFKLQNNLPTLDENKLSPEKIKHTQPSRIVLKPLPTQPPTIPEHRVHALPAMEPLQNRSIPMSPVKIKRGLTKSTIRELKKSTRKKRASREAAEVKMVICNADCEEADEVIESMRDSQRESYRENYQISTRAVSTRAISTRSKTRSRRGKKRKSEEILDTNMYHGRKRKKTSNKIVPTKKKDYSVCKFKILKILEGQSVVLSIKPKRRNTRGGVKGSKGVRGKSKSAKSTSKGNLKIKRTYTRRRGGKRVNIKTPRKNYKKSNKFAESNEINTPSHMLANMFANTSIQH